MSSLRAAWSESLPHLYIRVPIRMLDAQVLIEGTTITPTLPFTVTNEGNDYTIRVDAPEQAGSGGAGAAGSSGQAGAAGRSPVPGIRPFPLPVRPIFPVRPTFPVRPPFPGRGGAGMGGGGSGSSAPPPEWPASIAIDLRLRCNGMPAVPFTIRARLDTSAPTAMGAITLDG